MYVVTVVLMCVPFMASDNSPSRSSLPSLLKLPVLSSSLQSIGKSDGYIKHQDTLLYDVLVRTAINEGLQNFAHFNCLHSFLSICTCIANSSSILYGNLWWRKWIWLLRYIDSQSFLHYNIYTMIGASVSEPHINGTAMHAMYMYI